MNSKQKRTLKAVFAERAPGAVAWADIESLLKSIGCEVIEGRGSRVRFARGEEIELFHRPHPDKEARRYQVLAARAFLERLGVRP